MLAWGAASRSNPAGYCQICGDKSICEIALKRRVKCKNCDEKLLIGARFIVDGSGYCKDCYMKKKENKTRSLIQIWKELDIKKAKKAKASNLKDNIKFSVDHFRNLIQNNGLAQFKITNNINLKLKRNEQIYYMGTSYDDESYLILTSERLLYYVSKDNTEKGIQKCDFTKLTKGLHSKLLKNIVSVSLPQEESYTSRYDVKPTLWILNIHFTNGNPISLRFKLSKDINLFYVILNELIDRINDPIQEECMIPERQRIPDEVKIIVWRRDNGACVKCGSRVNLEFDHIIPVSKGGSNTARNIELLCEQCNRKKSDKVIP